MNRGKLHNGLSKFFDHTALDRIRGAKIGIAGAGGLGSNCASFLVRSGFVNFVIADFDRVEESNLNRQFYFERQVGMLKTDALRENLLLIEPSLSIETHSVKVTEQNAAELFGKCDAVVEAFDSAAGKAMLSTIITEKKIFLVCASGIAGYGSSDDIKVRRVSDTFYIVGDSLREAGDAYRPLAPRVAIAAAKQADIVLEYILTGKVS